MIFNISHFKLVFLLVFVLALFLLDFDVADILNQF